MKIYFYSIHEINLFFSAMTLEEIHSKYYNNIPFNIFKKIISLDPTYKPNKKGTGSYSKWLIKEYQQNPSLINDTSITVMLDKFNQLKNKRILSDNQVDIMRIPNIQSLKEIVDKYSLSDIKSKQDLKKEEKSNIKKLYDDSEWLLLIPLTHKASCVYGANTKWCTAGKNSEDTFNDYSDEGSLYILINKNTHKKWQFHPASGSYKNELDKDIETPDIYFNFYNKITGRLLNILRGIVPEIFSQKYDSIMEDVFEEFYDTLFNYMMVSEDIKPFISYIDKEALHNYLTNFLDEDEIDSLVFRNPELFIEESPEDDGVFSRSQIKEAQEIAQDKLEDSQAFDQFVTKIVDDFFNDISTFMKKYSYLSSANVFEDMLRKSFDIDRLKKELKENSVKFRDLYTKIQEFFTY